MSKQHTQPKQLSYIQRKLLESTQAMDAAELDLEYHKVRKDSFENGYRHTLSIPVNTLKHEKAHVGNIRACYLFHCKRISELKNLICRLSGQISSLTKNA